MQKLSEAQTRFMSEIMSEGVDPENPQWFEVFPQEKQTVRALYSRGLVDIQSVITEDEEIVQVCCVTAPPGEKLEDLRTKWGIPELDTTESV